MTAPTVSLVDSGSGHRFAITVAGDQALQALHDPLGYAAHRSLARRDAEGRLLDTRQQARQEHPCPRACNTST